MNGDNTSFNALYLSLLLWLNKSITQHVILHPCDVEVYRITSKQMRYQSVLVYIPCSRSQFELFTTVLYSLQEVNNELMASMGFLGSSFLIRSTILSKVRSWTHSSGVIEHFWRIACMRSSLQPTKLVCDQDLQKWKQRRKFEWSLVSGSNNNYLQQSINYLRPGPKLLLAFKIQLLSNFQVDF
ncbi:Hypothetical_protein [Hexamita inflata]|uniref:Hypothetical_protein n=1 Tax=Hexamita inflata TaxID=28002 RepID=A0ABP1GXF4_9EUKA